MQSCMGSKQSLSGLTPSLSAEPLSSQGAVSGQADEWLVLTWCQRTLGMRRTPHMGSGQRTEPRTPRPVESSLRLPGVSTGTSGLAQVRLPPTACCASGEAASSVGSCLDQVQTRRSVQATPREGGSMLLSKPQLRPVPSLGPSAHQVPSQRRLPQPLVRCVLKPRQAQPACCYSAS